MMMSWSVDIITRSISGQRSFLYLYGFFLENTTFLVSQTLWYHEEEQRLSLFARFMHLPRRRCWKDKGSLDSTWIWRGDLHHLSYLVAFTKFEILPCRLSWWMQTIYAFFPLQKIKKVKHYHAFSWAWHKEKIVGLPTTRHFSLPRPHHKNLKWLWTYSASALNFCRKMNLDVVITIR